MKAVITVLGEDKVGIIARITSVLAENKVNVLDVKQTILQKYFNMIMIVDLNKMNVNLKVLSEQLSNIGEEMGVSIKIRHEDLFNSMYTI